MGNSEHLGFGGKEFELRTCANVVVVASAKYAAALAESLTERAFPGIGIIERDPSEQIFSAEIRGAALVVVEVDPAIPASVERLNRLLEPHGVPVIAAIPDAPVALVRALVRGGVNDVLALPFTADELLETSLNVVSVSSTSESKVHRAPLIAVARSIGGCGATSIATNLAAALADCGKTGARAVVADLDLQCGSVADVLSAHGNGTISDLLEAGTRLDDELVRSVVRPSDDGVHVLAAPGDILPLDSVDTDQLLRILDALRREFDFVILDLPANWTDWALSACLAADAVLLVTELTVASLRQAKRRLDFFTSVGIPADHVEVIVNRMEKRLFRTIGLEDVAHTLRHPAFASVALDDPVVHSAQDQGRLVRAIHRRSAFWTDICRLAQALVNDRLGGTR